MPGETELETSVQGTVVVATLWGLHFSSLSEVYILL